MKILLFWSYYKKYIDDIYEKHTNLHTLSYNEQLDKILSDHFGWPPALVKKLEDQGHEVKILIVNSEPLQRAWTKENNCVFDSGKWQYEIPLQQVKSFSPDILWIGAMFDYFGEYLKELKPYCKKIFAWTACPIPKSLDLSYIDCFLTSHTNFRDYFVSSGKTCEILLPAFEEKILESIGIKDRDIECSFIGSLTWAHIERIKILRKLSDIVDIQIWADPPSLFVKRILKPGFIQSYIDFLRIRGKIYSGMWGLSMYGILARSQISVNIHGDVAFGLAGNMRMFEATGAGTLLVTEDAPNIRELFEPDKEVITYKNMDDLIDKIKYYTDKPKEREAIARAGQIRTLKNHSTIQRSKEIIEIFCRYL